MELDDKGGEEHPQKKASIQYCSVKGCDYSTESRHLARHMTRKHPEEKSAHSSNIESDSTTS